MDEKLRARLAGLLSPFLLLIWSLKFDLVNGEAPPSSVVFPSATPTFNYHDTVVIVWVTIWEETTVDIYCSQAPVYLPLYTASGNNGDSNSGTYTYPDIGSIFISRSYITTWPATCAITLVSSGISASVTGGDFVLTSDDSQPTILWGPSVTSTLSEAQASITAASVPPSSTVSSFTISSSTVFSTESPSPTTTTIITSTPSPSPSSSPSPSLSTGAKAGIAVGCTVAGLVIFGLIGLYLYRRHRRSMAKGSVAITAPEIEKPELSADSAASHTGSAAKINELPGSADASSHQGLNELHSDSPLYRPLELPA